MKFLEDLYANEYFGVVLFSIIAVLILMFIVILFFGLSDAKKTKKKIAKIDDIVNEEEQAFQSIDDTVKLDVVKDEEPVEVIDPVTEEVKPEIVIKKPIIDLSNLTIENYSGAEEVKEEIKTELSKSNDDEEIELPKKKQIDDISPETYDI